LLTDLPRHARRLLRRLMKRNSTRVPRSKPTIGYRNHQERCGLPDPEGVATRIERPPDKDFPDACAALHSLPFLGREALAFEFCIGADLTPR